jgi:hypothetical protein
MVQGSQLMLGAGFSAGRQKHDLFMPKDLVDPIPDGFVGPPLLRVLRAEGRVEGVLGFSFPLWRTRLALAAQPFYVVAQGTLSTVPCGSCLAGLRVDSFDAQWGATFTLTWLVSAP